MQVRWQNKLFSTACRTLLCVKEGKKFFGIKNCWSSSDFEISIWKKVLLFRAHTENDRSSKLVFGADISGICVSKIKATEY